MLGQVVKVPTFVGDDSTEGASFAPNATSNADFLQFFKDNYPGLTQQDLREINASYPLTPMRGDRPVWFGPVSDAYGKLVTVYTTGANNVDFSFRGRDVHLCWQ